MHSIGDTIAENIGDNSVYEVLVMEFFSLSPIKWWLIWLTNSMILAMLVLKLLMNGWSMTFLVMTLQLFLYKLIARIIMCIIGSQRTSKEEQEQQVDQTTPGLVQASARWQSKGRFCGIWFHT